MKNTTLTITLLAFIAVAFMACNSAKPAETTQTEEGLMGTYNVDVTTSVINWKGQVVGGLKFHTGTIALTEGSLTLDNGNIIGGNFTIDMKSMKTTDEDTHYDSSNGYGRGNLIGHLGSADFFMVDSFSTANFVVTSSDSTGVMGDLTIRGITQSEKIGDVVIIENDNGITVKGKLTFDRTKYGVQYQFNTVKEALLSNDVEIDIELSARP